MLWLFLSTIYVKIVNRKEIIKRPLALWGWVCSVSLTSICIYSCLTVIIWHVITDLVLSVLLKASITPWTWLHVTTRLSPKTGWQWTLCSKYIEINWYWTAKTVLMFIIMVVTLMWNIHACCRNNFTFCLIKGMFCVLSQVREVRVMESASKMITVKCGFDITKSS